MVGGCDLARAGDARPPAAGPVGELLAAARTSIEQLVGQPVESVSGVRAIDGGFRVDVEVVEVSRIPPTTDVLATYEVDLDAEGEVTGFARTDRYYRNQTRDA
nr:gas vesicle protein [Thermoanaerobacterales bacterium]